MLLTEKYITKRILERVKTQAPILFKNVTPHDIERLIDYYSYIISLIIRKGGFITLSVYKTHLWNRCIRIAPILRYVIYRKYKVKLVQKNYAIRKDINEKYGSTRL